MPPLSRAQYQGLYWTGCFASLSSIFGSTMVAWHCNSRRKTSMQHRLLFALSCTDLISSIMLMGLPSFVPEGTPGHFFAVGNATSCAVSGFFFVACFLATTFLNAGLSLYFLFTIRYGADPLTLRKRLELPLYILAPLICLLVATLGVIAQGYVPVPIFNSCFLGTCSISDIYEGGGCPEYNSVQDAYPDILSAVYISLVGIVTVPSCVATGLVYWTVRQRIRGRGVTSISFGFQNTSPEIAKKKLKLIGSQAIAYTLIYMNLLTWSLVLNILHVAAIKGQDLEGSTWSYILQLLSWLFIPGQGFLNCLAYSRPTYLLWKQRHHSDLPRWRLYWNALRMQDPGSGTVSLSMTPGAADSQGSGPRRQGYENPSTTKLEDSIVKNSPAETTATSEPEPPRRKLSSSVRGSSCLPAIDEDRSSQNFGLEEKEEPPPAPANEILTPPGGHRNVALQRKQESVDPCQDPCIMSYYP